MIRKLRRATSLLLMRGSVIARGIAIALSVEITFPDDEATVVSESVVGTTQVMVGLSDDGRGVHIGVQAIGGEHDGRQIVCFDVEPATASVLADSLTTAAAAAADDNDDDDS